MTTVKTIAELAQASATKLNITKYDIYGETVDETSAQVDQGQPKQVEASSRSSVIVRVWNEQNTMGVTSTTDVDELGLELALQTAQEASLFGAKDHVPDFSSEATKPIAVAHSTDIEQAPVSALVEKLLTAEAAIIESHEAIVGVPYNGLSQQNTSRFYLNSEGALREESHSYASIYLYAKTEQEGKKPRSGGSFRVSNSFQTLDVNGCIEEAKTKVISHLNYDKIKSGKYTVVFAPRAFLSLIGAFSNMFNAQSVLDKQSLCTPDSIGEAIASPYLSLADDALHPDNVGAEAFDEEGTPTRRLELINQGQLTHFLHSTVTAKRMNTNPTGHGRIGAKVGVGRHFYHVYSEVTPEQTFSLDQAENVILIDSLNALHAGVNSLQGSFSLPFDGWLIKAGEKISVDAATVAGDIKDVLKAIIYVEPEGEVVPGGISPHVWVKDLAVTGE